MKEYSDTCFNCGEDKAAIRHSQQIKDPIYCVTGSEVAEMGWEADQEYDRHRFVRTEKQRLAEEADELAMLESMQDFADFVNNIHSRGGNHVVS